MKSLHYILIGSLLCSIFTTSCEEYEDPIMFEKVNTLRATTATNITRLTATINGEVNLKTSASDIGFEVSTSSSMADAKIYRVSSSSGSITANLTGLAGGTTYYYRVYVSGGHNTLRSTTNSFKTDEYSVPTVGSAFEDTEQTTETTVTLTSSITDKGGADLLEIGFQYIKVDEEETNPSFDRATNVKATLNEDLASKDGESKQIKQTLTNLEPGTRYAIRAYCQNSQGTGYSSIPTFVTTKALELAVLSKPDFSAISINSAQVDASFSSLGKYEIIEKGIICSPEPFNVYSKDLDKYKRPSTIEDAMKISVSLTMLEEEKTYFICAYATTEEHGTVISGVEQMTTESHFAVSPKEYEFPMDGGTAEFKVTAYRASVSIDKTGDWFTANYDANTRVITVVAPENTGSSRRGTITVTATFEDKTTETIKVDLFMISTNKILDVPEDLVSLPCTEAEAIVPITASVAWKASTKADWLTVEPASGNTDADLKIIAKANEDESSDRTAVVVVSSDNRGTFEIPVTQAKRTYYFEVKETSMEFESESESKMLKITAADKWKATVDRNWVTITPSSDNKNAEMKITTTENLEATDRYATITFTTDRSGSQTVSIHQKGKSYNFRADTDWMEFGTEGSTQTIKLTADDKWTAKTTSDWLTLDTVEGSSDATISVTAATNYGIEDRTDVITIQALYAGTIQINVKQEKHVYTFSSGTTELSFEEEGSSAKFDLESDDSWTATTSETWLTLDKTKGSAGTAITATAASNKGEVARMATITVTSDHGEKITITASQAGLTPTLETSSDETYTVEAKGQTIQLNILSNTDWTADIPEGSTWCSATPLSGKGDGIITVTLAENEEYNVTRDAAIRVKGIDKTIYFEFTQGGADLVFSVEKEQLQANAFSWQELTLKVTANCSWTAQRADDSDWISLRLNNDGWNNKISGKNSAEIRIAVDQDYNRTTRTGSFVIKAADGTEKTITIVQSPKTMFDRNEFNDDKNLD